MMTSKRYGTGDRAAVFLVIAFIAGNATADDWPQWRGLNRDGISKETGLLQEWPSEGPRLLWTARGAGVGYSTPSIADGRMFLMGDHDESQFVIAFDTKTGDELWKRRVGRKWIDPKPFNYHGARCTPTVDGDRVYAVGTHGDLFCLKAESGEPIWSINMLERFKGDNIKWGISESPLIDDNRLFVMPGGEKATIVALNKLNGETIWTSHNPQRERREPASYASLLAVKINGTKQIIANTHEGGYAASINNGQFLWSHKMGGASSNTTPVVHDNRVFLTGNYGPGCALINASSEGDRVVYANRNLRNHTGGVVYIDGYLYGCSGAFGGEVMTCIDFETGKIAWKHRGAGDVSVLFADKRLYLRSTNGHVVLVKPTPNGYQPVSQFRAKERSGRPAWPHPIVSNGRLYLRDQDFVQCYDVVAN